MRKNICRVTLKSLDHSAGWSVQPPSSITIYCQISEAYQTFYIHDENVVVCFFSKFRNPDHDSNPWCYIYRGTQVAWEFCSVPKCTEGTAFKKTDDRVKLDRQSQAGSTDERLL